MKKHNKLLLIFFVIISTILLIWNTIRYSVSEPMPDLDYKKSILKSSHNITYTLEALRPLMGADELKEFILKNDSNPEIYTPTAENINTGKFRANLHTHTTKSDGYPTVEFRMDSAQEYAQRNIKNGYMVLAITDHNTVLGAKEVVRVLEKNKGKYKNIKVVLGIEIYTAFNNSKVSTEPVHIHVLTWCINPYDRFLNKEFYKKDPNDRWNRQFDRDFDWTITTMSNYGLAGPAHPARYTSSLKEKKYKYITEMLERYISLTKNVPYTEGYYQAYKDTSTAEHLGNEYDKYINYINSEAKRLNIVRTGSTDAHGRSLFRHH